METPKVGDHVTVACLESRTSYSGEVLSVFEGLEMIIVSIMSLEDNGRFIRNIIYYRKGG